MLLTKVEEMLDGKPPKIHPTQILQGGGFWTAPKQPHGSFIPGSAILAEELDSQHPSYQVRQFLEMQSTPGFESNRLLFQQKDVRLIRWSRWVRKFELCTILLRSLTRTNVFIITKKIARKR